MTESRSPLFVELGQRFESSGIVVVRPAPYLTGAKRDMSHVQQERTDQLR
jgi:hypothetical protein